jgi:hypothetical protein
MRRAVLLVLVLASACTAGAKRNDSALDGALVFRSLSEKENPMPCNQAPDFAVATTEAQWIDVFDLQTQCRPDQTQIDLPDVDLEREVGVAAWWKRVGCLGFTVKTDSVERKGDEIVVRAHSTAPDGVCATAIGQLESFIAIERSERFDGSQPMKFVLDGTSVGSSK